MKNAIATKSAKARKRRKKRIRAKISGTQQVPRLSVFRSAKHIHAQAIDDTNGKTLAAASSLKQSGTGNIESAKEVGKAIADACKSAGVQQVVFDRNGYVYHGRVKALAEAARESGLKF